MEISEFPEIDIRVSDVELSIPTSSKSAKCLFVRAEMNCGFSSLNNPFSEDQNSDTLQRVGDTKVQNVDTFLNLTNMTFNTSLRDSASSNKEVNQKRAALKARNIEARVLSINRCSIMFANDFSLIFVQVQ